MVRTNRVSVGASRVKKGKAGGKGATRHAVERPLYYDPVEGGTTRSAKERHVGPQTASVLQEKFVKMCVDAVRAAGGNGASVDEVEVWCQRNFGRYGVEPQQFRSRFRGKQLLTRELPTRGLVAKVEARDHSSGSAARYALTPAVAY